MVIAKSRIIDCGLLADGQIARNRGSVKSIREATADWSKRGGLHKPVAAAELDI